jgi:hypothetical protein
MTTPTSENFEAFIPVYDAVPETWEEGRQFLVEQLRKISTAINIREIGWLLDEEFLSGQQFIPSINISGGSNQFRTVLRKVVNCSPLVIGLNTFAHGIKFDVNFTLIQLYGAATNSVGLLAIPIPDGTTTISMDATNINITATAAFDRCFVVISYIQEL